MTAKDTWKEAVHVYETCEPYHAEAEGRTPRQLTPLGWRLIIAKDRFIQGIRTLRCRWFGHDLEMDGWAGPDSGGESWYCTRCGAGGSHTHY